MLDPDNVADVNNSEMLARYATQSSHFRRIDWTAKQDLFFPHPHIELSVTRHINATEDEMWQIGRNVAELQNKTLYGRADVKAEVFIEQELTLRKAPLANNPNHANTVGWATDKPNQKSKAQLIAAKSTFVKV